MSVDGVESPSKEQDAWIPSEIRKYAFRVLVTLFLPSLITFVLMLIVMWQLDRSETRIATIAESYRRQGVEQPRLFQGSIWVARVLPDLALNCSGLGMLVAAVGMRLGWSLLRTTLLGILTVMVVSLTYAYFFG